jgi:hypothetical protein
MRSGLPDLAKTRDDTLALTRASPTPWLRHVISDLLAGLTHDAEAFTGSGDVTPWHVDLIAVASIGRRIPQRSVTDEPGG